MTKQYIWALAIVGAFVAGTILASALYDNTAFAIHQPNHNPPGDDDDMGWKEAIDEQQQQIDDLKANEILGFYTKSGPTQGSGDPIFALAFCDDGDQKTGGGYFSSDANSNVVSNFPFGNNAWDVDWATSVDGVEYTAYILCADYAPEHLDP